MEEAMGALVANPREPRCRAQQSELNRREPLALGALGLAAGAPDITSSFEDITTGDLASHSEAGARWF